MQPRHQVSVIIPAYNQAKFLSAAIDSVLAQSYADYEIIVVDDGSTDNTRVVAQAYGDRIRYIYQNNLGLAGARNTGIRSANGEFIGLLDSDDVWLPKYLQTMISLAGRHPEAAVYFCGAQCIDEAGCVLPQLIGTKDIPPAHIYHHMLKANFIIPSSAMIRRDVLLAAGLFDQTLRSCEDYDLWLRLLPAHPFQFSSKVLVRYRIHGNSLSTNVEKMQQSLQTVIEKNFGVDDGSYQSWTDAKRQAHAGIYRYKLLTYIQRQNDWQCRECLRKALQIDHSLAKDNDMFYDIAMGNLAIGRRDSFTEIDIQGNERNIASLLGDLLKAETDPVSFTLIRRAFGTAYRALSLVAYNAGDFILSRRYAFRATGYRPELWLDPLLIGDLIKSFLGREVISFIRNLRMRLRESTKQKE